MPSVPPTNIGQLVSHNVVILTMSVSQYGLYSILLTFFGNFGGLIIAAVHEVLEVDFRAFEPLPCVENPPD